MSPDDSTEERADDSTAAREESDEVEPTSTNEVDEDADVSAMGDDSTVEATPETAGGAEGASPDATDGEPIDRPGRFGGTADRAVEQFDQRVVDVLSWILDTETRAKIYVHLLANPGSTSEEVAQGTGLYPSTVREALAALHDENRLTREKRASEGAGNNPYEYTAISPSELVGSVVDQIQAELNTIFNLETILRRDREREGDDVEPITITIDEADEEE